MGRKIRELEERIVKLQEDINALHRKIDNNAADARNGFEETEGRIEGFEVSTENKIDRWYNETKRRIDENDKKLKKNAQDIEDWMKERDAWIKDVKDLLGSAIPK